MQAYYIIQKGKIVKSTADKAVIHVFASPTEEEKQQIIQKLGVDSYDFDSALDPYEISRVEFEPDHTAIIWKQPRTETFDTKTQFDVLPVGFFIHGDSLTLILGEVEIPFEKKIFEGVNSIYDVILRYFFHTIRQYAMHLKTIKQAKLQLEGKLSKSMENKYFLQMFDISESLVYYIDAIEANGAVLSKLLARTNRSKGERLDFTPQQVDYLEDTLQENSQVARQAEIYSTVLSGLMDARGNVINNNMNVLLKNLTLINVVFLPLNLIASMGGMSEFTVMIEKYGLSWQIAYLIFSAVLVIVGWLTWEGLQRRIDRPTDEEDFKRTL